MKARLVAVPHKERRGETGVEVWWKDKLIGCVYGADGPGIRFISKHPLSRNAATISPESGSTLQELMVDPDMTGGLLE